jgi:predicted PurR-regulated permease PerM
MQRTPWLNILIILLVIIAAIYLAQLLWQFLSGFSDIILLFVLAWLVAFALAPLVERINGKPLPASIIRASQHIFGAGVAKRVERFRASRGQAVSVVYLGLALVLIMLISSLVPPTVAQINQLGTQLPDLAQRAPEYARLAQDTLTRLGIRVNIEAALLPALGSLQNVATPVLQNIGTILASVLSLIASLLLVLLLSFFFALDGPRLFRTIFDLVPESFDSEVLILTVTVDRTFGGFIRAQLLQALLVGIGTGIVMAFFRPEFVLVISLFSTLFMLIPFIGPLLALLPPLAVTLIEGPSQFLIVLVILVVYQGVVVNVVMPKLLSDALGLHPLVIIAALLIGIKVGGFWGAFFGVPVAGVIATMALYIYRRSKRQLPFLNNADVATSPASAPAASTPPPKRDLEKEHA